MKKNLLNLLLIVAVLFSGTATVFAQSKALRKDIKKTAKEMKKDGWKVLATGTTLEYALSKYRTYVEEDETNHVVITGIATGVNPKIGRDNAVMNGLTSYASRAKAQVVGKLKSVMSSEEAGGASPEEIDKFGAAYEIAVNTKISALVRQHFVVYREVNGKKEFQVYMTVDESLAKKAREDAAREAKQKAALNDLSDKVDGFIGTPVAPAE